MQPVHKTMGLGFQYKGGVNSISGPALAGNRSVTAQDKNTINPDAMGIYDVKRDFTSQNFRTLFEANRSNRIVSDLQKSLLLAKGPVFINLNDGKFSIITTDRKNIDIGNFCQGVMTFRAGVDPSFAKPEDVVIQQRAFKPYTAFSELNIFEEYDFSKGRFSSLGVTRGITKGVYDGRTSYYQQAFDFSGYVYVDPIVLEVLSKSGMLYA